MAEQARRRDSIWVGGILLTVSILLETTVQLFMKLGAREASATASGGLQVAAEAATSNWAIAGYVAMALQLPVWINVLARLDLSLAFPLASLSQVAVMVLSVVLLGEKVTAQHAAGVAAILVGSMLIASESEP